MKNQWIGVVAVMCAALSLGAGCGGRASAAGEAQAPSAVVAEPMLVEVEPNVWVVRQASEAVYYVGEYYWVYRDGQWYRTRSHDSDGQVVSVDGTVVPAVIAHRDHTKYAHYEGELNARTRPAPKGQPLASTEAPHEVADSSPPHGGPPGHDETPGLGNQRKAEGLQPGQATHSGDEGAPARDASASAPKVDAPGKRANYAKNNPRRKGSKKDTPKRQPKKK